MNKKKILIILTIILSLIIVLGGGIALYFVWKSNNNSFSNSPTKNDKPNIPNNPPPSDNPQKNNDKTELKVFWAGSLELFDAWKDYWKFSEAKEGEWMNPTNKTFLIAKNTPILVDKDLWQENLIFNLSYSKNQGSKVEKTDKDGNPILTIVENNFTLTPLSPIKSDPDFLNRWKNTKSKEVYFDYSQYSGGDYIFIDNKILQGNQNENNLDKFVFHPNNPSIQKLLAKNHLQNQPTRNDKQYRIFYSERDIEKTDLATHTYYFNNQATIKTAISRP
ncbi:MAG: hypothetical protein I3273_04445 [Candidatus Moeniiplasma glomeromycotorum]|nr:hypothetical protein [Candidatus Moeniiplasma glomeromycotorum]